MSALISGLWLYLAAGIAAIVGWLALRAKYKGEGVAEQKATDDAISAERDRKATQARDRMQTEGKAIETKVGGLPSSDLDKELSKWDRK